MATIQWGSWEYSGGNGMRVGISVDWEDISHGESVATLTLKIYTQNQNQYQDSQTLNYSGSAATDPSHGFFNGAGTNGSGNGPVVLRDTQTYDYTYGASEYGSSPGSRTFTATLSGAYNGVTPSRTVTTSIPARPYGVPAAPTNFDAAWVTDAQHSLAWHRNATVGEPYHSIQIQYRYWNGQEWVPWSTIATVSGSATNWQRQQGQPNSAYDYRVRARNSAGSSAWADDTSIRTTPAPPFGVESEVSSDGSTITTAWDNNAFWSSAPPLDRSFVVERSVNGGGWVEVATPAASPWTDNSPGAGSNRYRVATFTDYGGEPLTSTFTEGNTVSTIVPPLAPTQLAPDGQPADLWGEGVTLTWQHNHGGDGARQTSLSIEASSDGGSTWDPIATDVMSSEESHAVPSGWMPNGMTWLWRVRTTGVQTEGPGPWSSAATIQATSRPTVTLTDPPATTTTGHITASWSYAQAESVPQAQWSAILFDSENNLIESRTGTAEVTTEFTTFVTDGETYTVKVTAQSADGLWATVQEAITTVDFPQPAEVDTVPEWQPGTGTVVLHMTPQSPDIGEDPTVSVVVRRRVDGGPWVTLVEDLAVPTDFVDPLPSLAGVNEYLVISTSAIPAFFDNPVIAVSTPSGAVDGVPPDPAPPWAWISWVMLSYGPGWVSLLRFAGDPDISESTGRTRAAQAYAGRRRPRGVWGVNRSRSVSVSGTLHFDPLVTTGDPGPRDSSPPMDWVTAGQEADVVCLRDMHGRRVFGQVGDVQVSHRSPGIASISFEVTEIDYAEVYD